MDVLDRLESVKKEISDRAALAGKTSEEISLICVTKQAEVKDVVRVVRAGCFDLAENRVQALKEKYFYLKENLNQQEFSQINWHLIGHLQTNKVKPAVEMVKMIQSVDSVRLAQRISNQAQAINKKIDILIQINISGEESKSGIKFNEVIGFISKIIELPNINIKGLMGIGPFVEDTQKSRAVFSKLADVFNQTNKILLSHYNFYLSVLSMGMSSDYLVAIEEGSNMVRIGSAIFSK